MQIKITGDKAEWIEQDEINAGAIDYYKIDCEFDEAWEGLTKYAVFVQDCKAVSIAVIDNVLTVPKLEYVNSTKFGFVGYQIEDEEKTKQISTNMLTKYILDGAGDYEAEGHDMPTPSEWEIYLHTVQELVEEASQSATSAENFATSAQTSAENASISETNASTSENNASQSEQNAQESASNAYTSETNAKASEENAEDYKDRCEEIYNNIQEYHDDTKQDVSDEGLETTNKSIVGAINEVNQKANTNESDINTIEEKIPTQASSTNQLGDKDFINSSLNSITAFYITKNANGDPFDTKAELTNATVFYSGGEVREPTRNDYCAVLEDETKDNATTRYIFQNNQWEYQYTVNETALTAAQLAAINSGITQALVGQISTNQTNIAGILADYIKSTDYAGNGIAGVFKASSSNATAVSNIGYLYALTKTYEQYLSSPNEIFIGKGTLDNVLAHEIGSINEVLDTIQGEVI